MITPATTIRIRNAHFPDWAEVAAPTVEKPYWHDADTGTRHSVSTVMAGMAGEDQQRIADMHAHSVQRLVEASLEFEHAGNRSKARALAAAASRLCGEVVGMWPT